MARCFSRPEAFAHRGHQQPRLSNPTLTPRQMHNIKSYPNTSQTRLARSMAVEAGEAGAAPPQGSPQ